MRFRFQNCDPPESIENRVRGGGYKAHSEIPL